MPTRNNQQTEVMKISMFGDAATGKTSLGMRFAKGQCTAGYTATVGVDFFIKPITIDGRDMKLHIWGLAHTPAQHTTDEIHTRDTADRHGGPEDVQTHCNVVLQCRPGDHHRL